ncbi:hypothetical protein QF035_006450 [Streptomyces umbrinus]|uniref:DUF397 domain-containing protein n=1 Tax=Streptomyces umbrinus TaxID=67370 RepID=A0ABU0SZJ6_9ACTN|nr:DUF397 domain-containing protein [Streptomyces umbrinus]MDQ1028868.1 hypothetical protein [Streptomyces umbrinus]
MPELTWQKSSYSAEAANCVYVAATSVGAIHLRESDEPEVILSTTRDRMSALIRTLKTNPSIRSA